MTAAAEMPEAVQAAIERFDSACKSWGWQEDQGHVGTDIQASEAEYAAARLALIDAILADRRSHSAARRTVTNDAAAIRKIITEGSGFADTNPEARFISDAELSCPHCGGSGHKDDVRDQWQPIETAPKDGTPVDLWGVNHLHYAKTGRRATNVTWGPVRDWMGRERNDWQHGHPEDFEPTHWQPLPVAPKGGAE